MRITIGILAFAALAWALLAAGSSLAQDPRDGAPLRPRVLAPGVLTTIPLERDGTETFTGPFPMVEIVEGMKELDWEPNFTAKSETLREIASRTILRRRVWELEFTFKPLRMIEVDLPQPSGLLERKQIWYLVYRIKNPGFHLQPKEEKDRFGHATYTTEPVNFSVRFFPEFVLESLEHDKAYLDRVIPLAVEKIQRREDPAIKLHDSVSITRMNIPVSDEENDHSVWGVATWEDVDPRTDFFSVFVRGLSNAYRFEDAEGGFKAGDPPGTGRVFSFRTLRLNFYRPGDAFHEHENELRFGIPLVEDPAAEQRILGIYGLPTRVDYLWTYR